MKVVPESFLIWLKLSQMSLALDSWLVMETPSADPSSIDQQSALLLNVLYWLLTGGLEFLIAFASLFVMYGIIWVQWAPTGWLGGKLIAIGLYLEHTPNEEHGALFEQLGFEFQDMGGDMRQECLDNCGWLAPIPFL